ncbi:MAG: nucleotidyl transferase AbiEii/AbiGii toxin family protein [Candidatus Susulua stagnicola]|nr:nucleotidyl transferase AbiEii/AbiGii toxin family protein [Candidatus Susulua stagnicola]
MSIKIIQERFDTYQCGSQQEEENALREISQEIALAALSRGDFFKKAVFHGGTCLRIFYSMERFSEDLDFMLKNADQHFSFEPYIKNMAMEFQSYGYRLEVVDRSKTEDIVKKCFLKDDSLGKVLNLTHFKGVTNMRKIKIKLEVDTNPPIGSNFENKFLDFPFPFSATIQDMPSLFAGKSHALLCREYTKGRDWYDFIWYVSRRININWEFLSEAINQQGPWKGQNIKINRNWYINKMVKRIEGIDWKAVKQEMARFLKPSAMIGLDLWGKEFLSDRLQKLSEII